MAVVLVLLCRHTETSRGDGFPDVYAGDEVYTGNEDVAGDEVYTGNEDVTGNDAHIKHEAPVRFPIPIIQPSNETIARQLGVADARNEGIFQLDLTGSGVTIGLWDVGLPRNTHAEFESRLTLMESGTSSFDKHATNMAGTAIAAGLLPEARGMAPAASLQAYLANDDVEITTMGTAAASGLRISYHPYTYSAGWRNSGIDTEARPDITWTWTGTTTYSQTEDFIFGHYASRTARWDSLVYAQPHFLVIKAAGNQHDVGPAVQPEEHWVFNFDTNSWEVSDAIRDLNGAGTSSSSLSYASLAKNVLTVGAALLNTPTYADASSVQIRSSSGRGGADDGRIKPELVVLSDVTETPSSGSDTDYSSAGGTSSAAAVTGGVSALVLEQYRRQFARDPRASTYKALLIHTADPTGSGAGPDYTFGFGLLNAGRALRYLEAAGRGAAQVIHREETLFNGDSRTYSLSHDGNGPLLFTLVWTDPAGEVISTASADVLNNRTPALVHDLDLRVSDPSGTVWMPWTLNPDNPTQDAVRADNTTDPVEMVRVDAPLEGVYTITVTHKGGLDAAGQGFSLFGGPAEILHRRFTLAEAGWRIISVPHTGVSYRALNNYFFTQGGPAAEWSTYTGASSNLWLFDAPTGTYEAASPMGGVFRPGHGYLLYMYPDNPPGFPEKQWLPGSWFTHGDPIYQVDVDLSEAEDWFLAGNPFSQVLDWQQTYLASDGVRPGIALWNPAVSVNAGASGDQSGFIYRSAEMDLGDEEPFIAPFSGFFVQRDDAAEAMLRFRRDQIKQGASVGLYGKVRRQVLFSGLDVRPIGGEGSEFGDMVSSVRVIADDRSESGYDWLDIDRVAELSGGFSVSSLVDGRSLVWDVRPPEQLGMGTVVQLSLCGVPPGTTAFEVGAWGSMGASFGVADADVVVGKGRVVRVDARDLAIGADGCRLLDVRVQGGAAATSFGTGEGEELPGGVRLAAAYPNPFNATTTVRFDLPSSAPVQLRVFDIMGRQVAELANAEHPAGTHEMRFDASHLPSGIYVIELNTPSQRIQQSITLLK